MGEKEDQFRSLKLRCPQGHQWEVPAGGETAVTGPTLLCPVCGTATEAATRPPDEFPPPPTPAADEAWPRVPGYEILGVLGRGGMGVVYKARQTSLNRLVALKMLHRGARPGPEELSRFRVEAEAVARLSHTNIVHIYDVGEQQGLPYFSMEYVDGGSLAQKLAGMPLSPRQAAELLETLARAVHKAHRAGIIHRDLKPANILLTADGVAKITDFGLAKRLDQETDQTKSGLILGTPTYMSPEQAKGQPKQIGPATDVYALGAILYELLTGRPPFRAPTALETLQQISFVAPTPPSRVCPSVPRRLEQICLKCLRKEPHERYASAADLADDLRSFLGEGSASEKRRRLLAVSLLPLVLILGIGLTALAIKWFGPGGRPVAVADGGGWQSLSKITAGEETFDHLVFPAREIGFAAGRARLYKTEDGGGRWLPLAGTEGLGRVYVCYFADTRRGWVGAERARLLHTRDGGMTWQPVSLPVEVRAITAVVSRPDGLTLAGGNARDDGAVNLFRQSPDRPGWEPLDAGRGGYWGAGGRYRLWSVRKLAALGDGPVLAVLSGGTEQGGVLLRSDDRGNTWSVVFGPDRDLFDVHFLDESRGWLTGGDGSLWKTADGGARWEREALPEPIAPTCLAFDPQGGPFGIAPLWKGRVLVTADGKTWEAQEVRLGYSMPGAAVADAGRAYVLDSEGNVARYDDPRVAAR